jgi:3-oxoacyl-[acyl-carrier protein] reductase
MDLGLADRSYIVTGGTRGLGRAAVTVLLAEGASVLVTGRSLPSAEDLASWGGERLHGIAADNRDPSTAARLVEAALERFGRLDGLLVSVGGPPPGSALDVDDGAWQAAFESVFLGAVRLARTVGKELAARDGGAIGLVLSTSVRSPIPKLTISNGLRPGLAMVAKELADELGPSGVRVVSLAPGRINTERLAELTASDPRARADIEASIPLRRIARPEEFGKVAAFLLSPAASYVTGCVVPVDGGMLRGL